jgi:hypothetical protein
MMLGNNVHDAVYMAAHAATRKAVNRIVVGGIDTAVDLAVYRAVFNAMWVAIRVGAKNETDAYDPIDRADLQRCAVTDSRTNGLCGRQSCV